MKSIYNARSNRHHPPTSPNTAPATLNDSHGWCPSHIYEMSFTMRGATGITLQPHQILRLPRKIAFQNLREIARKQMKCHLQCTTDSSMIRPWSEPDRPWTRHLAPARSPSLIFALRRRILYWILQHFTLRLSTQIWPNTAPATKSQTATSPNSAPATKSDTATSPNIVHAMKSGTKLLLDWTVTLLSCHFTEVLLYWTVT